MSRIGKKPILIPTGVSVAVSGNLILVTGPKGELTREIHQNINIEVQKGEIGGQIIISPGVSSKKTPALWGLTRSLVANMIEGVTAGYEKKLEIEGIGYRVSVEGNNLIMQLGFSHPVRVEAPVGIKFSVQKNSISVAGIDKELVGETAAKIYSQKPPEPYKGKGIRYKGEIIRRKIGKKAVAST